MAVWQLIPHPQSERGTSLFEYGSRPRPRAITAGAQTSRKRSGMSTAMKVAGTHLGEAGREEDGPRRVSSRHYRLWPSRGPVSYFRRRRKGLDRCGLRAAKGFPSPGLHHQGPILRLGGGAWVSAFGRVPGVGWRIGWYKHGGPSDTNRETTTWGETRGEA